MDIIIRPFSFNLLWNHIDNKRILESMNPNTLAENLNSHVNGKLLEWFMCDSKVDSFNCTFCANCFWMLIIEQHSWSGLRNYWNENFQLEFSIGLKCHFKSINVIIGMMSTDFSVLTLITTLVWWLLHLRTSTK